SAEAVATFLSPAISQITPEFAGIDRQMFVIARGIIEQAIYKNEHIVVLGHHDIDGIIGTRILSHAIKKKGGIVSTLIPHRLERYGITKYSVDKVLTDPRVKLLITVDSGIAAHEAIAYARSKGLQVIVLDHHTKITPEDPQANLLLHTTRTSASGIAYLLGK